MDTVKFKDLDHSNVRGLGDRECLPKGHLFLTLSVHTRYTKDGRTTIRDWDTQNIWDAYHRSDDPGEGDYTMVEPVFSVDVRIPIDLEQSFMVNTSQYPVWVGHLCDVFLSARELWGETRVASVMLCYFMVRLQCFPLVLEYMTPHQRLEFCNVVKGRVVVHVTESIVEITEVPCIKRPGMIDLVTESAFGAADLDIDPWLYQFLEKRDDKRYVTLFLGCVSVESIYESRSVYL